MENKFAYAGEGWGKDDPKERIIEQISPKSRVLDVGCGVGAFGKWLKTNLGCYVAGADGHPVAVKTAAKNLDSVELLDLDDLVKAKSFFKKQKFDFITFIDVLEHCHHPKELLELAAAALSDGGKIIVSLPNVAHLSVRMKLLKGNFDYTETGLLDRTHVHFYTKKTSAELLRSAGLTIEKTFNTSPQTGWKSLLSKIDDTLTAVQYVMVASPKK